MEPERFTGSRLPADLVHLRGTDGDDKRLERCPGWQLRDERSVLSREHATASAPPAASSKSRYRSLTASRRFECNLISTDRHSYRNARDIPLDSARRAAIVLAQKWRPR